MSVTGWGEGLPARTAPIPLSNGQDGDVFTVDRQIPEELLDGAMAVELVSVLRAGRRLVAVRRGDPVGLGFVDYLNRLPSRKAE